MPQYRTELEQLAGLVPEDAEPLDTASMLAQSLQQQLSGVAEEYPSPVPHTAQSGHVPRRHTLPDGLSTETLLSGLYEVLDDAVASFEAIDQSTSYGSVSANRVVRTIHGIQQCIKYVGGVVEPFNPLDHVSGLAVPGMMKNAERVVQNTEQCYSRGLVKAQVSTNEGNKVEVVFSGTYGDIAYSAVGSISAQSWDGNEAIDYIYTPEGGKMSVKRLSAGRWADISESFDIHWQLMEQPVEELQNHEDAPGEDIRKKSASLEQERTSLTQKEGKNTTGVEQNKHESVLKEVPKYHEEATNSQRPSKA